MHDCVSNSGGRLPDDASRVLWILLWAIRAWFCFSSVLQRGVPSVRRS
jgi:hypothetical protein